MDISSFARCAAYAAFGFACGGVMFCRFMPLLFAKKDITKLGRESRFCKRIYKLRDTARVAVPVS